MKTGATKDNCDVLFPFGVKPNLEAYIGLGDFIRVQIYNVRAGQELWINFRILQLDGTLSSTRDPVTPTDDRLETVFVKTLPEGFLQSVSITANNIVTRRGETFARVGIQRTQANVAFDNSLFRVFASGYVTSRSAVSWPGKIEEPTEGGGFYRMTTQNSVGLVCPDPVPVNTLRRLIGARLVLVTVAGGGNRVAMLQASNLAGGQIYMTAIAQAPVGPSFTAIYYFGLNHRPEELATGVADLIMTVPIPDDVFLSLTPTKAFGTEASIDLFGMTAGDILLANFMYEEWLDP